MTELRTISPDELLELSEIPEDLRALVFSPGGPVQAVPYEQLLTKLIATDLCKATKAVLDADLAHPADSVALVFSDGVTANNGWYRKVGASGSGSWSQFEELSRNSRILSEAAAASAAQSAAYAGGFETPEYASQAAGNEATTAGQIFRVPNGTTPQTFTWYRRLASGSEIVSPLATSGALAAASGAELVGHDDGAGGSFWGNVAGFISYLRSSSGGTIVGVIATAFGAVVRTVQDKSSDYLSIFDFMSLPLRVKVALRLTTSADAPAIRAAIQAAIDATIYNGSAAQANGRKKKVWGPAGLYWTDDTIHLGYGITFNSVHVEFEGWNYRGENLFNGAVINVTFSDRPAVNFQGSRGSVLRGVAIKGLLGPYIVTNNLASPIAAPGFDDVLHQNWNNPALAATQDSRYCPYAAVTVDAYSGPRPATSYPNVSYPAFLGAVSQYGKAFSSDVTLDSVYIQGFNTALAVQPCDADGNGDFVKVKSNYWEQCKYGLSVGNSQSRNVSVDGLVAHQMYAIFTNNKHGRQIGKFGGNVRDLSAYWIINLFEFGSYYAGPMTFTNPYVEAIWRIGTQVTSARTETAITFHNPEFYFTLQDDVRGVPADVLSGGGGGDAGSMVFDAGTFWGYPSVLGFNYNGLSFRGGSQFRKDTRAKAYERFAHNATCGGLVTLRLSNVDGLSDLKTSYYNLDTGTVESVTRRTPLWRWSSRKNCVPFYAPNIGAQDEVFDSFPNPSAYFSGIVNKAADFSSLTLVDRTLTGTFNSRADWRFMNNGPLPGDVIWDDQTGMTFFVRSRTGNTFIAEAQNNYRSNGSGGFFAMVPFTSVGNLYIRNSRLYVPRFYLRGDTTAGNATISNVGRDDGFATWYNTEIAVDDAFAIRATQDRWLSDANPFISARDQSAGTITLAATSGLRTQTRKRFDLFIRTGPANEASR